MCVSTLSRAKWIFLWHLVLGLSLKELLEDTLVVERYADVIKGSNYMNIIFE